MADNSVAPGTGETFAFDDIGGIKYQRAKLIHGADGVNDGDVSTANPLPVNVLGTSLPNIITVEAAYTAAQTDVAIVSATSPDRIVCSRVTVTVDKANTVDVGFRVGFGATNTPTTTGVVSSHPGLAAGDSLTIGDGSGVLGIGAAGEDLRITCEVPTTGSIRVVVSYYLTT